MNGLAITIIVGQLPKLFGFSTEADGFVEEVQAFFSNLDQTNTTTLILGTRDAPRSPGIAAGHHEGSRRC